MHTLFSLPDLPIKQAFSRIRHFHRLANALLFAAGRFNRLVRWPPFLFVLLLLPCTFFSCTVTKRMHRPGYHVEWKRSLKKTATSPETVAAIREPEAGSPVDAPVQVQATVVFDSASPVSDADHTSVGSSARKPPAPGKQMEIVVHKKPAALEARDPVLKKQHVRHNRETASQNRGHGGFERFLLLLLVAIVLVPVLLLVMVFSVVTFNVQSVLLGLLLLLLLIVLIVVLIF